MPRTRQGLWQLGAGDSQHETRDFSPITGRNRVLPTTGMSLEGETELQMGMQPQWTLRLQPWQTPSRRPSCAHAGAADPWKRGFKNINKKNLTNQILQEGPAVRVHDFVLN